MLFIRILVDMCVLLLYYDLIFTPKQITMVNFRAIVNEKLYHPRSSSTLPNQNHERGDLFFSVSEDNVLCSSRV